MFGTRLTFIDLATATEAALSFDWQAHVDRSRTVTKDSHVPTLVRPRSRHPHPSGGEGRHRLAQWLAEVA